jgi:predicted membrane channel-forming protein YqfA (hemolysin III family)|tara:strand:- start:725 stop:964 length:240 start_codon:yes stop_codon:yes gene_type:complete
LQIAAIWAGVLIAGIVALFGYSDDRLYTAFAAIAGSAIALVSLEHLFSRKAKDTVRQQIYVSTGTVSILGLLTLIAMVR